MKLTGQKDSEGNLLTSNPDTSGRYHSTWLSMMYPRLFLARQLLREDGVIFISIDKREEANLRHLMNEVFGEENFIASICVVSNWKGRSDDNYIATAHDSLLMYQQGKFETLGLPLPEEYLSEYPEEGEEGNAFRLLGLRKRGSASRREDRPNMFYPFFVDPETGQVRVDKSPEFPIKVTPKLSDGSDGRWRWVKETARDRIDELTARIVQGTERFDVFQIDYAEIDGKSRRIKPKSVWNDKAFSNEAGTLSYKRLMGKQIKFDNPKPPALIKHCLIQATKDDDIILDFFAGSGSVFQAVFEQNRADENRRRVIGIQLPEPIDPDSSTAKQGFHTVAEVSKERIRRVISQIQKSDEGKFPFPTDEDLGFKVFKLAPSNMRLWSGVKDIDPQEYIHQMSLFKDPLVEGWQIHNVIYEVALREGYSLTSTIEEVTLELDNTIYRVTDPDKEQHFHICLDTHISPDPTYQLGLNQTDLFICRDIALDDTTAANIALNGRLKTI